jgi:hypothetical protein
MGGLEWNRKNGIRSCAELSASIPVIYSGDSPDPELIADGSQLSHQPQLWIFQVLLSMASLVFL